MSDDGKVRENGKPGVWRAENSPPGESSSSNIPASDIFSADTMAGFTPSTIGADSWAGTSRVEGELEPGTVIGNRYEIMQMLGEGGMGAVYKAGPRNEIAASALKVIRPELAGNPSILERFKQELLLAPQVTHKNVIRIYDLGEADGMKFITMEFVEGQDSLPHSCGTRSISPEEAIEIMRQVCRALEAAHAVGVDPSRSEAAKHHARQQRADPGDGLRPRAHHRGRWHDPVRQRWSGRWNTCRPSRRSANRSISAPTSSRWA